MDVNTGKIMVLGDEGLDVLFQKLRESLIEIRPEDMTPKQKENMQVSLHDNRSILGRKRVEASRILNGNKRKKTRRNRRNK